MSKGNWHVENSSKGIGFTGLLTIVFIVLKLVGVISWSWFWVLSPIIFSVIFTIIILLIILLAMIISVL